jgi:hypothetical protein
MRTRTLPVVAVLLLAVWCHAGEGQPAPKKFDWSDPKTLKAYWEWVAAKVSFPALITKTGFDAAPEEKGLAAVAMLESAAPTSNAAMKPRPSCCPWKT